MFGILGKPILLGTVFRLGLRNQLRVRRLTDRSRTFYEMSKVYFRSDENVFHVSFLFDEPEIGISKPCNLCRRVTETVETFLQRVNCNVDKLVQKKFKKVVKAGGTAPVVNTNLYLNGTEIARDLVCGEFFTDGFSGDLVLEVMEKRYDVLINLPCIQSLTLPDNIMAGFPAYPAKLEGHFIERSLCQYQWFKSKNHAKDTWTQCGEGFSYAPTTEDIGYYLKIQCTPKNESTTGPIFERITDGTVGAGPGLCPFELRHMVTAIPCARSSIRIMSYNILANLYADSVDSKTRLFPYCPEYALSLAYRKQLLLKEIVGYQADVLCLQEVDGKVFRNDLVPMLAYQNLKGEYSEKGGTVSEGTVVFYNTDKFALISSENIIQGEEIDKNPLFEPIWQKIRDNAAFCARFQCRTTCAQVVALQSLTNPKELLLVGNTHLYFHPDADHVRLLQGIAAFMFLLDQRRKLQERFPEKTISMVMCGDFNSTPDGGIYEFMTTGSVDNDHIDWRSNPTEAVANVSFSHSHNIASACGIPEYTNYTAGFKACLDYIFYETDRLCVEQVVPFPSVEELSANVAIPSIVCPSDHIALIADLKWTTRDDTCDPWKGHTISCCENCY